MKILERMEDSISDWLYRRKLKRALKRYGGTQTCPWCKQCAQLYRGSYFDSYTDPYIDALRCGNCGGVSRWRFEMGMLPLDPIGLSPPPVRCEIPDTHATGNLYKKGDTLYISLGMEKSDVKSVEGSTSVLWRYVQKDGIDQIVGVTIFDFEKKGIAAINCPPAEHPRSCDCAGCWTGITNPVIADEKPSLSDNLRKLYASIKPTAFLLTNWDKVMHGRKSRKK